MKSFKWTLVVLSGLLLQFPVHAGFFRAIAEKSVSETAKSTMVSIVSETRPFYRSGMSETAFIDAVLVDIPRQKRSTEITNYFKKVYDYHKRGSSDQDIRLQEKGETLLALAERASDTSLNGAFFNDTNDPAVTAFRPLKWWLRLLLEILPIIIGLL